MASIITTGSTQASAGTILGGKAIWSGRLIGASPTQAEPKNIGFGQGDPAGTRITALVTDMGLSGEVVANGGQTTRIAGSSSQVTTTGGNYLDTYQVVGTMTCNISSLAIVEAALFDANPFPGQTTVSALGALSGTGTGTTTFTSGSGLPTASTNYQVDSEIVTGTLSGNTLTITSRGVNGSTAAAHTGSPIITVVSPTGTLGGGVMAAKGDFAVINLVSGDTLQLTAKIQFT